jgi:NAD-dependent deacetylase
MVSQEDVERAAELLRASQRPCVLTGAGASKESGIPTFRDAMDGVWAQYDPEELATPKAFARNPKLVWEFYEMRRERMRPALPNPGHKALANLERYFSALPIITQNVDNLHERAGSTRVVHLHGFIEQNKCSGNCKGNPTLIDVAALSWTGDEGPPACPHCGALVRPNVVWFGEMLPPAQLDEATALSESCDVMLIIGTSGIVTPAADMPLLAKRRGAALIEVNPFPSALTSIVDMWLQSSSGEALPRILSAMS